MRLELTDTNVKRTFLVCVSIYKSGVRGGSNKLHGPVYVLFFPNDE